MKSQKYSIARSESLGHPDLFKKHGSLQNSFLSQKWELSERCLEKTHLVHLFLFLALLLSTRLTGFKDLPGLQIRPAGGWQKRFNQRWPSLYKEIWESTCRVLSGCVLKCRYLQWLLQWNSLIWTIQDFYFFFPSGLHFLFFFKLNKWK